MSFCDAFYAVSPRLEFPRLAFRARSNNRLQISALPGCEQRVFITSFHSNAVYLHARTERRIGLSSRLFEQQYVAQKANVSPLNGRVLGIGFSADFPQLADNKNRAYRSTSMSDLIWKNFNSNAELEGCCAAIARYFYRFLPFRDILFFLSRAIYHSPRIFDYPCDACFPRLAISKRIPR